VKAYLGIGTMLVRAVSAEEIYAARDSSSAWISGSTGKKGPWESHFLAMALKSAVKISRKFWPMTSPILENVISYLNEDAGEGYSSGPVTLGVAAREMGVPGIGVDEAIPMPQMSIDPRVDMALNPGRESDQQPVQRAAKQEQMSAPVERTQRAQSAKESSPIAEQGQPADESSVDPKIVERINSVLNRCIRLKSWQGGLEWVANNLSGEAYNLAMSLFNDAQAAESARAA
jgi:recombination protein RecT